MVWGEVNPIYEARYADNWTTLSRDTKRMQQEGDKVRCSCCGGLFDWDFVETHHAYYLGDADTPGLNLFPVCGNTSEPGTCHHWLHLKEQWHHDKTDAVWSSGNYQEVVDRLRLGWRGYPHLTPYDFDWGVLARVCAWLLGSTILVSALVAYKNQDSSAKVSRQIVTVSAPAPYNAANVRKSPNGNIIGALKNGAKVEIAKQQGDWCFVDGQGWIFCKYLGSN